MKDFDATYVTAIGNEESFGENKSEIEPREAALWMAVQHREKKALDIWAREIASAGTGMAPGLCQLVGGRPKPSPCLKLFSFLYPKANLPALIQLNEDTFEYLCQIPDQISAQSQAKKEHLKINLKSGANTYKLGDLAYARSGDKGDSCNIGVIARQERFLPYIKHLLTEQVVHDYFKHFIDDGGKVTRFDVPGIHAVNFLLEKSLGGGGIASLRPDPLGKSFAQMLLSIELKNCPEMSEM